MCRWQTVRLVKIVSNVLLSDYHRHLCDNFKWNFFTHIKYQMIKLGLEIIFSMNLHICRLVSANHHVQSTNKQCCGAQQPCSVHQSTSGKRKIAGKRQFPDPWHFETDPNFWIRTQDCAYRSRSFRLWLLRCQQITSYFFSCGFLLITYCRYGTFIYISLRNW
jgi:hypothetical protein